EQAGCSMAVRKGEASRTDCEQREQAGCSMAVRKGEASRTDCEQREQAGCSMAARKLHMVLVIIEEEHSINGTRKG
ncbi:MAG: hypothetical protein PWP24_708, partial [Clostridiales bacterium]|nr:hypothetical protein [Clostridiales bacterium]